ncbi:MAG: hypothetical protein Q9N62_12615 [Ghiorsea sp.]|nr:hypothetical protein [Ghiorsea sp.]
MKIINSIVVVLFFILGFSAAYANPAGNWLKSTEQLEGDRPHTINEIKSFLQSAEPIIEAGSDNPIFWYVLGIYGKRVFGDYYRQAKRLGNYSPNNPEAQALVKQYSFYYRKSLDANDKPNAPVHLGVDELMSIASNILISPDIKERAYKKAIRLMQANGDAVPDGCEYTTYQFLLESYSAQKNPEKY